MTWSPDFSSAKPEPQLEPFRQAIGELVLEGEVVGHIATEVSQIAERAHGWLWWRSWRVNEFLALTITALADDSPLPDWDDPWWFPEYDHGARSVSELAAGQFTYPDVRVADGPDVTYEVKWITDDKFEDAWRQFGPQTAMG